MKKSLIPLTAACAVLLGGSVQLRADKVPPGQVPKAVLKAISEQTKTKGEMAQDIERETKDGKVTYEVEFRREGVNQRIKFYEDGSQVTEDKALADVKSSPPARNAVPPALKKEQTGNKAPEVVRDGTRPDRERVREKIGDSETQTISLGQLPDAVQKTVKAHGDVANLKSIKQEEKNGIVAYAVEFEKSGKNVQLKIGQDGMILDDSRR